MNQGALHFETLLTTRDFEAGMQRIRNDIKGVSNLAVQETARMDSAFKNLSLGIAGYFSASSLKGFVMELINIRGEFQKTEIAFSTMLGNAAQAKALMGQMVDLAAKTPFDLKQVSDGAKQLLAFQVPANEVVDTLTRMGNIAAGLSVPISRINLVFGQVKAKGRLMGDDLRQFTEAGIPMIHELAKSLGKADSEISQMVSDGKIGFEDVKKVLWSLTNEGGMFFNLMEKQSASLSGKISNLQDAWDQMLNKIGQSQEGVLAGGIDQLAYLVDNYQEVIQVLAGLVAMYGAYKVALIATSAIENAKSTSTGIEIALLRGVQKAKIEAVLAAEMKANADAKEATVELASAKSKYTLLQAEVSLLDVKKQSAVQSATLAQQKLTEAQANLVAADQSATAAGVEISAKKILSAQNQVSKAEDIAAIARKKALALNSEFYASKIALESAAASGVTGKQLQQMQAEVSLLSAKRKTAVQSATNAQFRLNEANAALVAARAEVTSSSSTKAVRAVEIAQNKVIKAQEDASITRKKALATSSQLYTAKQTLENTAVAIGAAEKKVAAMTELANAASKEVNAIATTKLTALQWLQVISTRAAITSVNKLGEALAKTNAALKSALIMGLVLAIGKMASEGSKATQIQDSLNEKLIDTKKSAAEQEATIVSLIDSIKSENTTNEQKKALLTQLNNATEGKIKNLSIEKIKTGELDSQVKKYIETIYQQAEAEAYLADMKALYSKKAANNDQIERLKKEGASFKDTVSSLFDVNTWTTTGKNGSFFTTSNSTAIINNFEKENAEVDKAIEKRKAYLKNNPVVVKPVVTVDSESSLKTSMGKIEKLEDEIKNIQERKRKSNSDKEIASLNALEKIKEKELKRLNGQTEKKENRQLAEILPVGSIAELQRRAQLINEAIDVAVNGMVKLRKLDKYGKDKDKSGNPFYTGQIISVDDAYKQLDIIEEAIKLKQRKSFDEEVSETERQWNVRYQLANKYGEEVAKAQFPNLKGVSYFDEIEKRIREFEDKTSKGFKLSDKELQNWAKLNDIYRNLTGEKDPKTQFADDLEARLNKMNSQSEKVAYLQREHDRIVSQESTGNSNRRGQGFEAILNQRLESEKKIQKDNYNNLIKEHRSFEEKKAEITKEFEANMSFAKNDSERDKIKKVYGEQLSALTVEAFRASKDWELAFSNIEYVSRGTADRVVKQLIEWREANKNTLNPQDYKIVSDKIEEFQRKAVSAFSVQPIITSWKNYRKATEDTEKAEKELEDANKELALSFIKLMAASNMSAEDAKKAIDEYEASTEKAKKAKEKLDHQQSTKDSFLNNLKKDFSNWGDKTSQIVNQVGGAINSVEGIVTDLGGSLDNEFGDALDKMKGVLEGVGQIADGMKEFASGGPVGMVTGSIKMIGGVVKAVSSLFNNDKKKERQIQSWAREVENLKNVYAELEYTVKKALGENVYKGQLDEIKNLERQKALLSQMAQKEGDKKKKDQGKIDEYNAKMAEIDRTISDIRDNIIKTVLQTDAKDVASQLGDALVEAFSKGEDAAKSLDKAAGDVFRNMVKNALKMRMEESLKGVLDQILKASGFDEKGNGSFKGFTPEQIEQYKKQIAQIGASQEEFLKAYQQLFQDANSNVSGMEGSIKSITSEEAGDLIAQINAMRINQGKTINIHQENLELMRGVLMQLMKIEDNTRNLHQMRKDLSELNSKVSKDNGLRPAGL